MDNLRTPGNEPTPIDSPLPADHEREDNTALPPDSGAIDTPADPVDESSEDSFPASDPPSFTGTTD